jgi:hypothetical protein
VSQPGYQISVRCRVRGQLGASLHLMPRRMCSRAVAMVLAASAEGIDLDKLIAAREELRRVGLLLNQSCMISHQMGVPEAALGARTERAIELINALVRAGEDSA